MSAFQLSQQQISEIAKAYTAIDRTCNVKEVAKVLAVQNIVSLEYRCPDMADDDDTGTKLFVAVCQDETDGLRKVTDPMALLKLTICYQYQSCEDPGWKNSEAYRISEWVKSSAIAQLPGYAEAPWTI